MANWDAGMFSDTELAGIFVYFCCLQRLNCGNFKQDDDFRTSVVGHRKTGKGLG